MLTILLKAVEGMPIYVVLLQLLKSACLFSCLLGTYQIVKKLELRQNDTRQGFTKSSFIAGIAGPARARWLCHLALDPGSSHET